MLRVVCRAKLHRLRVTGANLDYMGSIGIDGGLLAAAGILPYEMVQIANRANGVLWRTYVVPEAEGSGRVVLNGPPARHFQPGDEVIVLSLAWVTAEEAEGWVPTLVFVDEANRLTEVRRGETAGPEARR
ncbi:MAG: aspartate 1-decarboxylase [Clostridia bacterium]|nr:aspartate 1-decarboxylase [Clostridia bacterium]MCL6521224.1 aspartate 1-decarboxylase [Bacillota bacterium]